MKIVLLKLLLFSALFSNGQSVVLFGDRCLGTWEGTMHLYSKGSLRDSIVGVLLRQLKANSRG
jgi:hypothetical protein